MVGDERLRLCLRCQGQVRDVSAMSEAEAEAFLAAEAEGGDAPLYRRPDGRILTSECVGGVERRHRQRVMVAVIAAVVLTAGIAVAGAMRPANRRQVAVTSHYAPAQPAAPPATIDWLALDMAPPPPRWRSMRDDRDPGAGARVKELYAESSPNGQSRDAMRRIIRQSFGRFRLCYEEALRLDPTLACQVDLRVVIERDGTVGKTFVGTTSGVAERVASCVVSVVQRMSFPALDGGAETFAYGVAFATDG
jgi:hypothetical protein